MKKLLLAALIGINLMASDIIVKESSCDVDKTMQNVKSLIEARGLKIFTLLDHQENARSVGLLMPKSKLIIFGNPKIGTSFMISQMIAGLDLPMKILVYEDSDSKVKIAYRDGTWLAKEHDLPISFEEAKINKAMDKIVDKAGKCIQD